MKVYGGKAFREVLKGKIRSNRPEWLLEELGVQYDRHTLDVMGGETKKPEYLALNPFGKFPVIEDGDFTLFESAAICQYIAEKHKKFIPASGTPEYYTCIQWCYFAMTNIESNTLLTFVAKAFMEPGEAANVIGARGRDRLPTYLAPLNEIFGKQDTIVKSGFTIADILLTTSLLYADDEVVAAYPNVQAYLKRMSDRPAFKRSQDLNGA